jgi:alcohol dehydrogenase
VNIDVMRARDPHNPALAKYARVGRLFSAHGPLDDVGAHGLLVSVLDGWTRTMSLPTLSALGVGAPDVPRIIANCRGSSMKTNPVVLNDDEVAQILAARLG